MEALYIVSTPLGSLEDITLRALRILKEVDIIAAEDTRHTKKLLTHYDIHKPLVSFFEGNEMKRLDGLIGEIKSGKNVALVSDAGTPAISDPGFKFVRAAISEGIEVIPVPGPSAAITALSASGLPTDQFTFVGFLPDKEGKRKTKLGELKDYNHTLVFYVSKWKIEKVLADMLEIFGDRPAAMCREMTKVYEEIKRGNISKILESVKGKEIKGEITLVVGGA
ncbi:MAG: 16S rRNA (cytidine(1402)-2'-O)-methyltransferase [Deltaproteobacteria bacterium]|nr:16S rRNA (cytidine(1402)-2'-O)-methyltransferase [Deltaproteobacteria bacterium]